MRPVDKATREEKDADLAEAELDPRLDWEKEDDSLEGKKPDLSEIEDDEGGL